jgi:copper chaperone CopZ
MRFTNLIPVLMIFVIAVGCGQEEKTHEETIDEYQTATISLETMKCQMCASFVQHAAKKVDGVSEMDVDLERKVGTVRFDPEKTSLDIIELAIANAGYNANETKRDEEVYATLPDCCK